MNEITGVRGWKLGYDNDGYVLYSLTTEFAWRGPVTWSSEPPTAKNSSGLYSARARRQLYHELHRAYQPVVHGRIALLGHVVEHQLGFRSAGAIVRSLYLVRTPPFGTQDPDIIAKSLAQRYACDVALSPHVKAWRARRRQMGYDELTVVNLFALRATDPRELIRARLAMKDVVGPGNDGHLRIQLERHDFIVAAWGQWVAQGWLAYRDDQVRELIRETGRDVHHLGLTIRQQPKHPLYLGGDSIPQLWDIPA